MSVRIELRIQLVDASLCRKLKSPAQGRAVSEGVIEETEVVLVSPCWLLLTYVKYRRIGKPISL